MVVDAFACFLFGFGLPFSMRRIPGPALRLIPSSRRVCSLLAALTLAGRAPRAAAGGTPPDDPTPASGITARSWLPGSGITPGFEPDRALDIDPRTYWASNDPTPDSPKDIGIEFNPPQIILGLQLEFVEEPEGTLHGPRDPQTAVLEIRPLERIGWLQPACSVSLSRLPAGGALGSWILPEPTAVTAARVLFVTGPRPAVRTILPVWRRWALAWTGTAQNGRSASMPLAHGLAWNPPPMAEGLQSIRLQYPAPSADGGLLVEFLTRSLHDAQPAEGIRLEAGPAGMAGPPAAVPEPSLLASRPIAPSLGLLVEEWLFPGPAEPAELFTLAAAPQLGRPLPGAVGGLPQIVSVRPLIEHVQPGRAAGRIPPSPGPVVDPHSAGALAARAAAEATALGDLEVVRLLSLGAPASHDGTTGAPGFYPMVGKAMLGLPLAPREAAALVHGTLLAAVTLNGEPAVLGIGPLHGDTPASPLLACEIRRSRDSGPPPSIHVELIPGAPPAPGQPRSATQSDAGMLAPDDAFAVSACVVPAGGPSGALLARFVPPPTGPWHLGVFARDARRLGEPLQPEHLLDLPRLLRPAATDAPPTEWQPWMAAGESIPAIFVRGAAVAGPPATIGRQLAWSLAGAGPIEVLVPLDTSAPPTREANGAPAALTVMPPMPPAPDELQALARDVWLAALPPTGIDLAAADPEMHRIARACREQILIAAEPERIPYGAFPSVYDGEFFGVEEYWPIRALALWGDGEQAARLMRGTFLHPAYLDPRSRHHQYRHGLLGQYTWDLFSLTGDTDLLGHAAPLLVEAAEWILAQTAATRLADPSSPYAGLLPRYRYGGDRSDPAYSLYANSCCWRGLRDTGLALATLGEQSAADRYLQAAQAYRSVIFAAIDRVTQRDQEPHLIPFRADHEGPVPTVGDYYQLFAGLSLETGALEPAGERSQTILRYLAKHGRTLAGIPRFGTPPGTDAHYGRGLLQELLHEQRWMEHRLALLTYLTVAVDPVWCSFGEVVPLLTSPGLRRHFELAQASDWHHAPGSGADPAAPWHVSDPNACGPGVLLEAIRNGALFEELDAEALPTGRLHLLPAAFPEWFAGIRATGLASPYGRVDFTSEQPGPDLIRIRFALRPHPPGTEHPALAAIRLHCPDNTWLTTTPRIQGGTRTETGPTWIEIQPNQRSVEIELRR